MASFYEETKDINVLLLGESGVGKSTFINSCYNYFKHPTLEHVLTNTLDVLIPAKFDITDKNFEQQTVTLGDISKDVNECFEDAAAATQDVRVYNFPIKVKGKKYRLRFLDTPGVGDQRGADRDKYNCERILGVISQLTEIHGFCLLLKPGNARLDVFLNYCITQLLSRLESSAVNNIVFVFTNTRGENFTPGKTYTPLSVLVRQFKEEGNTVIPLSKKNMFCFDNEAFRYAGAIKSGVQLDEYVYSVTELSWDISSKELWRMIEYAVNIKPHDLYKTIIINESKMLASELNTPLSEILSTIQDNLRSIEITTKELEKANLTYEELVQVMHRPQYKIKITSLNKRQTVCQHPSCVEVMEVDGIRKTHYKKICCVDCLGTQLFCSIFVSRGFRCSACGHAYGQHHQIHHKTEIIRETMDESMLPEVNRHSNLIKAKQDYLKTLERLTEEYEKERYYILETCAIIKMFLKQNSITATGDHTEEYLHLQLASTSNEVVKKARTILREYNKMKDELDKIMVDSKMIKPEEIKERKEKLFALKHFGNQIKEAVMLKENTMRENVFNREMIEIRECYKKFDN